MVQQRAVAFSSSFLRPFLKVVISKWKDASENIDSQLAFVGPVKKRRVLYL